LKNGSHDDSWLRILVICAPWVSSLGISVEEAKGLVHIPENPVYHIDRKPEAFADFFYRTSYLSKVESKCFGD
jgi:hypothetical protein